MRFQVQSFAKALRRDTCPRAALGALWRVPPPSRAPSGSPYGPEPRSRPLSGIPPVGLRRGASLRWHQQRQTPTALCRASRAGLFPLRPFCLLDPWTPKLSANRSEAPLAFRMKSADFLNSSGHSCIRSGPCAFPTQRVKSVFEGWGRVKLENIFRSCTLTDSDSGGTLSSSVPIRFS